MQSFLYICYTLPMGVKQGRHQIVYLMGNRMVSLNSFSPIKRNKRKNKVLGGEEGKLRRHLNHFNCVD